MGSHQALGWRDDSDWVICISWQLPQFTCLGFLLPPSFFLQTGPHSARASCLLTVHLLSCSPPFTVPFPVSSTVPGSSTGSWSSKSCTTAPFPPALCCPLCARSNTRHTGQKVLEAHCFPSAFYSKSACLIVLYRIWSISTHSYKATPPSKTLLSFLMGSILPTVHRLSLIPSLTIPFPLG